MSWFKSLFSKPVPRVDIRSPDFKTVVTCWECHGKGGTVDLVNQTVTICPACRGLGKL